MKPLEVNVILLVVRAVGSFIPVVNGFMGNKEYYGDTAYSNFN